MGHRWPVFDPLYRMLLVLGEVRLAVLFQQEIKHSSMMISERCRGLSVWLHSSIEIGML